METKMTSLRAVVLCVLLAGVNADINYVVMSTPSSIAVNQVATFVCRAVATPTGQGDPTLTWSLLNVNTNVRTTLTGAVVVDFSGRSAANTNDGYRQETLDITVTSVNSVNHRIYCQAAHNSNTQEVFADLAITGVILGGQCDTITSCSVPNSQCISGICQCSAGYVASGSTQCILSSTANLNEQCGGSITCAVLNSQCVSGFCLCNSGYTAVGTTQCILSATLGEQCSNTVTCSVQNSQCSSITSRCECRSGYYAFGTTQCNIQSSFSQSCQTGYDSCRTTNAICNGGICQCPATGYSYTASTDSCDQITTATLGGQCSNTITCSVQNSQCSSITARCVCRSGYYAVGTTQCLFQSAYSQACQTGYDSCRTTNANCNTGTCLCPNGYSYAALTDSCDLITSTNLGGQCGSGITCSVTNSQCTNSFCRCINGYYAFGNDQCILKSSYSQQCRQGYDSCLTTNAQCTGTCTCPNGYEYTVSTNSCDQITSANLGEQCGGSTQCTVASSECRNFICQCVAGTYSVGTTQCRQPYLGESCVSSCLDTSTSSSDTIRPICSSTSSTCVCQDGYYGYNNVCYRKITLDASCNAAASSPCADSNAACTGSPATCSCRSNYNNVGGVCTASIPTQCPANTQYDVVTPGSRNPTSPDIYIGATCYVIQLYRAQLLPCVDVTPSNLIQPLRSGGWEKLGANGQFARINGSTTGLINGDHLNTNLTISNAQAEFAGIYRCHLCYGSDSVSQCTNSPDVTVIIDGIQITATAVSLSGTAIKGQSLTLSCSTTPPNVATQYVWRRNNLPLGITSSRLTISSVSLQDGGSYTCTASNNVGVVAAVTSDPVVVTVQYSPEYSLPGGGTTLTITRNLDTTTAVLDCAAYMTAVPAISTYRFAKGSTVLYSGPNGQYTVTSTEGYGDYTCTASNQYGDSNPPLAFGVQQGEGPNVGAATEDDGGISTGAIAAIVLGIIFLLLLIIIIIVCCCNYGWCRKKEKVEPQVIVAPPVKPYIPRGFVNTDQASTVSRKDVGIMMNGTHRTAVSTEYEEPYTPRYYLKPATESGPIISMFEDNHNMPRAHQLPALDTQYLYRDEEPKKKKKRRKKRSHRHEAPAPEPTTPRYAEVQPPEDDDLVVIPGPRHTYYE